MKTNKDYLDRIRQEEELKNRLLDTLENKKRQINQYFTEYVHSSEE
jgi:vacuolar-type H+-ATPase subunit D/Vma8